MSRDWADMRRGEFDDTSADTLFPDLIPGERPRKQMPGQGLLDDRSGLRCVCGYEASSGQDLDEHCVAAGDDQDHAQAH